MNTTTTTPPPAHATTTTTMTNNTNTAADADADAVADADARSTPLPKNAAAALTSPDDLWLELHVIAYSHYCARAKWYLSACGLKADALHPLLPVQHVPHMIALLREFSAARCAPTASSRSPAATPALSVYTVAADAAGKRQRGAPLCLLQDSELIGRWAALRAQQQGDGGAAARRLYGPEARLEVVEEGVAVAEDGSPTPPRRRAFVVLSSSDANTPTPEAALLERRFSGVLGVEARRLVYYHLLPRLDIGVRLFVRNVPSSAPWWQRNIAAPLWALAGAAALPKLLNVNRATAIERGLPLLEQELDALDAMVDARGCLAEEKKAGEDEEEDRIAAFLCGAGKEPSAADISLAALGGIIAGDLSPPGAYGAVLPALEEFPQGYQDLLRTRLLPRPSMRYARALWREHGAAAVAAAVATTTA
jgi:hypothetical protein